MVTTTQNTSNIDKDKSEGRSKKYKPRNYYKPRNLVQWVCQQIRGEHRSLVIKEEVRRLQRLGTVGYESSAIISFPKSYVREFGFKKGDIFVFSVVNKSPPTFMQFLVVVYFFNLSVYGINNRS